jgi:hypothetical protein
MELKNAVAVCLISMFSATLVVLIARSLDNQAASRLEPQLAQIAEELRAIRTQGGIAAAAGNPAAAQALDDGLVVYYFHGEIRCPTCRAIESQSHETVENDFAEQLRSGEMAWRIVNYEKPESADLTKKFDVHMANVVLARMDGGEIKNWKRLDQVWALVGDKPAFAEFVRTEISQMLAESPPPADPPEESNPVDLPLPDMSPPPLPQSDAPADVPLPE